jgi:hypothetical protein
MNTTILLINCLLFVLLGIDYNCTVIEYGFYFRDYTKLQKIKAFLFFAFTLGMIYYLIIIIIQMY